MKETEGSWFLPPAFKDPYTCLFNQESKQPSNATARLPETYEPSPVDKAASILLVAKINK